MVLRHLFISRSSRYIRVHCDTIVRFRIYPFISFMVEKGFDKTHKDNESRIGGSTDSSSDSFCFDTVSTFV